MAPAISLQALARPLALRAPAPPPAACSDQMAVALDCVAKSLRGARARTRLSEADVVAILERQGISLTVAALRNAESTGAIPLALACCLADIYGTTTDGLAGRRMQLKRPSLDDFPGRA